MYSGLHTTGILRMLPATHVLGLQVCLCGAENSALVRATKKDNLSVAKRQLFLYTQRPLNGNCGSYDN